MKLSKEEFRKSFTDPKKRLYLEVALSDMLGVDFDSIHNKLVIDDESIIKNERLELNLRSDAIVLSFADFIAIVFKNDTLAEKKDDNIEKIMHNLSHEYPNYQIVAINVNDIETQ